MSDATEIRYSLGDVISRKYEIVEHLGDGLFGATYRARHIASGKDLVIKFLWPEINENPGNRAVFEDAFKRSKAIRHPALVRNGEFTEHNGNWYFTQEYFKSLDLRKLLEEHNTNNTTFGLREACEIIIKALDGLQAGHAGGLHHFDLKPENILIATERSGPGGAKVVQRIKLSDMGLALTVGSLKTQENFESRPEYIYQAPELATFSRGGSAQTDVYSMGVILYEALCGETPSSPLVFPSVRKKELPKHIDQVVELALAPDLEDRYPTADDMATDIQRTFQEEMLSSSRPSSFRSILTAIGLGVLIAGGVGGYLKMRPPVDPLAEARAQDDQLRAQVQAANPLPSTDEYRIKNNRSDMVYIPSGSFVAGKLNQELATASSDEPLAQVTQVDAYYIDRYEYPNVRGEVPVHMVTYTRAQETCEAFGKRLCSAVEWEKACKGTRNSIYTYGDTWDGEICGNYTTEGYTMGTFSECHSSFSAFDMSGGLREWTSGTGGARLDRRAVKGGSISSPEQGYRCAFTEYLRENYGASDGSLGFRCCFDAD